MNKLLPGCLLALLLVAPATVRAEEPPDPFAAYPVVQHGNLHVHTAISSSPEDHSTAQKVWETLNEADDIGLDFVGLADHAEALADEHFLVTRGTTAVHPEQTGRPVIGLPGFELTLGGLFDYDRILHLNVFGSDHYAQVGGQGVKWPVLRVGRFVPNPPYGRDNLHWNAMLDGFRNLPVLPLSLLLHPTRLHEGVVNHSLELWSASTLSQQLPASGRESDQYADNTVDTAWGYRMEPHPSALSLARSLKYQSVAALRQVESKTVERLALLLALGPLSGQMHGVVGVFEDSRLDLIVRLSGSQDGGPHTLALPPVVPDDNPYLGSAAYTANERLFRLYGEYYTLLWRGLHLWDGAEIPGSAAQLKDRLESDRHTWWEKKGNTVLDPDQGDTPEGQLYAWLDSYPGSEPIVAQINHPNGGSTLDIFGKLSGEKHLGIPRGGGTTTHANLWKRVCLMEVAANQDKEDHGTGPFGTKYSGIAVQLPFYNLALANHWRVAPSAGIDNNGWLKANDAGLAAPRARQSYVGVWLPELPSGSVSRMKAVLQGLRGRRTFVSEQPDVQLRFSAVPLDVQGRPRGGGVTMGGDLASQAGADDFSATFLLELRATGSRDFRVRNEDITIVKVRDLAGFNPVWIAKAMASVNIDLLDSMTRDKEVLVAGTASPSFRKRTLEEVVGWSTSASPREPWPEAFRRRDSQGRLLASGERTFGPGRPLRLQVSRSLQKFGPDLSGHTLCLYALVRFREGDKVWYTVSAPLWLTGDDSYASLL